MADYNLKLNINGVETAIASIEDLETALKATTSEMKTLQVGSEAFNDAAKNAKKLQSELDSINEKTKNIDTKEAAKSFAKLGETVTGAFAVASSAIALFGSESQDVAKAQAQAQQAIALVLGARAIAEGVVEGAAAARLVVDKVSLVTTGLLSSVFGELTVAQAAQAAAAGTATTAQLALNAAMKAAPYVLIISAVIALGVALFDTEEVTRDYNKELDDLAAKLSIVNGEIKNTVSFNDQLTSATIDLYEATGQVGQAFKDAFGDNTITDKADISIASMKKNAELLATAIKNTDSALQSASGAVDTFQKKQGNSAFVVDQQLASYKQIAELFSPGGPGTEGDEDRVKNQQELLDLAVKAKKIDDEKVALTNQLLLLEERIKIVAAEKDKADQDAAKKRAEAYAKELKVVQDITDASTKTRIDAETKYVNTVEQLRVDAIKNKEKQAIAQQDLDLKIALQGIEANKKAEEQKVLDSTLSKKDKAAALAIIDQNASDNEITATAETALKKEVIEQEYAAKRLEIQNILNEELAYGDYNLSDRKKKLALEELSFDQQMAIKQGEFDLQVGAMTVANTKATIEAVRLEKEAAAITERDLRYEEIDAQYQEDLDRAQQQFEEGLIIKEERDAIIKGLEDQAREEKKQADLDAIMAVETANAEASQRNIELKKQETDAMFAITNQSISAMQGLSDLYFAIKMANVKKGSAEEEKAARQQFKINKALAIASATISTIQGVINALTAQSVIPEPYGTILKVVSAVAVGAAGAANIAKISSQQFQGGGGGGAVTPTAPSAGGADGGGGASTIIQAASTGGFTSFGSGLVGTPGGGTSTGGGNTGGGGGAQRVYVVESDITNTQRRVSVSESNATF